MLPKSPRRRLGAMLIADGVISESQLRDALDIQKETGKPLGQVLIEQRYVSEESLVKALSEQYQLPFIDPSTYQIDEELVKSFPVDMLYRYQFVPLDKIGRVMTVAIAGIIDENLDDFIREVMGCEPMYFIATYSSVMRVLEKVVPLSEEQRMAVKDKIKEDARRISDRISARVGAIKTPSGREKKPKEKAAGQKAASPPKKVAAEPAPARREAKKEKKRPEKVAEKAPSEPPPPPPPPPPEPKPVEVAEDTGEAEPVLEIGAVEEKSGNSIDWQALFDEVDRRIREEADRRRNLRRKGLL